MSEPPSSVCPPTKSIRRDAELHPRDAGATTASSRLFSSVRFAIRTPPPIFCQKIMDAARPQAKPAPQGWLGLFLLAVCWPLNWMLPGVRTAYLFFPLWLGYILVVDALVCRRASTSLWTRSRRGFVLLFILSVPAWWLFEIINWRTGNWEYLGAGAFTPFEYYALCTISFSTVMPAVFETAELVRTFRWVKSLPAGTRIPDTPRVNFRNAVRAGWSCWR